MSSETSTLENPTAMDSPESINAFFDDDVFSVMENQPSSLSLSQQDHQEQNPSHFHKTLIKNPMASGSSSPIDTIPSHGVIFGGNTQFINPSLSTSSSIDHGLNQETLDTQSNPEVQTVVTHPVTNRSMQFINSNSSIPSFSDHSLNQETINFHSDPEIQTVVASPMINRSELRNEGGALCMADPTVDSVVKVFCVHSHPDYLEPWQSPEQVTSCSSGIVMKERRILTTAFSVENYVQVMLRKRDSHVIYTATVIAIGNECDLALLTVEDDKFWEGMIPVEFGDLPALQDSVTIVGFPVAAYTVSVIGAVVSQSDILPYAYGASEFLGLQINTTVVIGISGAPAFGETGKCVGVASQGVDIEVDEVEGVGFVIPTPIIMHFIQDYEKNGRYTETNCCCLTGFPSLGVEWQKMENRHLRLSFGMESNQTGVRVKRIDPNSSTFRVLKSSDIILRFDGVNIANDGTIPFWPGERIRFSNLVSLKYTGDIAEIDVLRNSEILKFIVELGPQRKLIPTHSNGRPPSYYIIGGLVFTTVSLPYLRAEYGKNYNLEAPVKLLNKLLHEMPKFPDEEIVIFTQVLPSDINVGYEDVVTSQVLAFNGEPVRNLRHLVDMVEGCTDEYLKFDLDYEDILVLRTKEAKAATSQVLSENGIPAGMSTDLMDLSM